ncbi:MAG: hypothetical protein QOG28_2525, partial [Trebonia sp.]|nr:hypothetical protein [Trebonia sp.]
ERDLVARTRGGQRPGECLGVGVGVPQVSLVIGGSAGLGLAIAVALAQTNPAQAAGPT